MTRCPRPSVGGSALFSLQRTRWSVKCCPVVQGRPGKGANADTPFETVLLLSPTYFSFSYFTLVNFCLLHTAEKTPLLLCGIMQSSVEGKLIQKDRNWAVACIPSQLLGAIPQLEPPASANRLDRTICMKTKASECPSSSLKWHPGQGQREWWETYM